MKKSNKWFLFFAITIIILIGLMFFVRAKSLKPIYKELTEELTCEDNCCKQAIGQMITDKGFLVPPEGCPNNSTEIRIKCPTAPPYCKPIK